MQSCGVFRSVFSHGHDLLLVAISLAILSASSADAERPSLDHSPGSDGFLKYTEDSITALHDLLNDRSQSGGVAEGETESSILQAENNSGSNSGAMRPRGNRKVSTVAEAAEGDKTTPHVIEQEQGVVDVISHHQEPVSLEATGRQQHVEPILPHYSDMAEIGHHLEDSVPFLAGQLGHSLSGDEQDQQAMAVLQPAAEKAKEVSKEYKAALHSLSDNVNAFATGSKSFQHAVYHLHTTKAQDLQQSLDSGLRSGG